VWEDVVLSARVRSLLMLNGAMNALGLDVCSLAVTMMGHP